jgi:hypothetical protein
MSHKNIFQEINKEYSFLDDLEEPKSAQIKQKQPEKTERYLNNYNIDEIPQKSEMEESLERSREEYLKTAQGKFVNRQIKDEMTLDEAYELLDVKKGASDSDLVELVDKSNLDTIRISIKKEESKYYAFLNKEFNVLNMKMIKCCIHCYDNPIVINANLAIVSQRGEEVC